MRRLVTLVLSVTTAGWLSGTASAFTAVSEPCLNGGVRSIDPNPLPGCWFLGPAGASCSDVCATHGFYDDATLTVTGSAGGDFNCDVILTLLGGPTGLNHTCSLGLGCEVETSGQPFRCSPSPATTADASSPTAQRVCACTGQPAPTVSKLGFAVTALLLLIAGGAVVRWQRNESN